MFNDLKWYNVAIVVSNTSKFDLNIDGIKVVSKLGDTWPIFDRNIFWDSNYVAYAGHALEQHSIRNITIDDFIGEVKNVYIWTRILDHLEIGNLCDGVAFANASSKLHVSYNPSVPFLDMQSYTEKNIIKTSCVSSQSSNIKDASKAHDMYGVHGMCSNGTKVTMRECIGHGYRWVKIT